MEDLSTLEALLLLQRIPGLGPKRLQQLLDVFYSPAAIWQADAEQLRIMPHGISDEILAVQRQGKNHASWQRMLHDLDYMDAQHIHILTQEDEFYPGLLKETDSAPALLYVRGDPSYLSQPQIAIVGARKASSQTLQLSYEWAQQLSQAGLIVSSGLALGVDGAAHQGAIDGNKPTIAVLAHGLDSLYPQRHLAMAQQIELCGALVTEFPLGTMAKREHFPRRNRIISGLSLALLVTEAAVKSGSMISAQYAIEQNRDVFAVPGHINNTQMAGCHQLIQQGAYLATSARDILSAMNWQVGDVNSLSYSADSLVNRLPCELTPQQQQLIKMIPFSPTHIDELIQQSEIPAAVLATQLLELEMLNYVECIGGNYQRIQ